MSTLDPEHEDRAAGRRRLAPADPEAPQVSVIIPCFNEEESVDELVSELFGVLDGLDRSAEVVIVDDGSTDKTWERLCAAARREPRLRLVRFRRNFGQTAAMMAAIDEARGAVIVPIDADLQNDPASIPKLLAKIDAGYDVVSGWRRERKDKFFSRRLPSMIANAIISRVSGVHLHDYGCTLKAYRAEVLRQVDLYGEMHRFIPIYASWVGAKVTEEVAHHRARKYGTSKYGIARTFKVVLDLLVVKFLGSYGTKPIYFFGSLTALLCGSGTVIAGITLYEKLAQGVWVHKNPLLTIAVFLFTLGVQSLFLGLLAEIGIRTYHESQQRKIYNVRERFSADSETAARADVARAPARGAERT